MARTSLVAELVELAGSFGAAAAAAKLDALQRLQRQPPTGARELAALHDALCFLRAYPDNQRVLSATETAVVDLRRRTDATTRTTESPALADSGFPGSTNHGEFSLPLVRRLTGCYPGCFEIDWEEFVEQDALVNALGLLVTSGECQGLDDIRFNLDEWFAACRPPSQNTDLGFLMTLLEHGPLGGLARDQLYENCRVPLRYQMFATGTSRAEIARPVARSHYQKKPLGRRRSPLLATVRRPYAIRRRLGRRAGEDVVLLAQRALCARGLEIRTLTYANPADVWLLDGGHGISVTLIGVVPDYRDPLECHYCCVVLKNGVPIAYGPATVFFGCCEIGINFFPEFRGAEVGYIYPQFIRALYHVLGARYFFLTPYGMGVGNPAAIRTGAFWFYRKFGFVPDNPRVDGLAREEEERMADNPRHRSSPAMLRRLSHTGAYLDLSDGRYRPLDLGALGIRESRFIAETFAGDRGRAMKTTIAQVSRILGASGVAKLPRPQLRAWEILSPLIAMLPGLPGWTEADRRGMLRILAAKGGDSEHGVDRLMLRHRFSSEVRGLLGRPQSRADLKVTSRSGER